MAKSSEQTQNLPQITGNGVIPYGIQHIEQRMRQTFPTRSLSEGNVAPNMSRNNDDDEFDETNDPNKPPPVLTSSSEPIVRTVKGHYTKVDNSKHQTNISSFNAEHNEIIKSFNDNFDPRESVCAFLFPTLAYYREI